MQVNLLDKKYNKYCNLFVMGYISLELFIKFENEYVKRYQLYNINLN